MEISDIRIVKFCIERLKSAILQICVRLARKPHFRQSEMHKTQKYGDMQAFKKKTKSQVCCIY